jgi:hypothetical protein
MEDGAAALHREAGRRGAVELGGVDDVADRGQGADHRSPGGGDPARLAGLRVERVDVAVEGADIDGGPGVAGAGYGRPGVHVAARRVAPGQFPIGDVEAVDARVVVAGVDAAERDGRSRIELTGPPEARA